MVAGGEFFGRSRIAERRSVRVCPLCSWRKIAWQQRFYLGQTRRHPSDVRFASLADMSSAIRSARRRGTSEMRSSNVSPESARPPQT